MRKSMEEFMGNQATSEETRITGDTKSVVIIGASGHGKVVADIVQKSGDRLAGFLDDNPNLSETFIGFPVLGKVSDYQKFNNNVGFVIAIGNAEIRERIAQKLSGVYWYTAVHPKASISDIGVEIGEGTVIAANAVINSDAHIGKHCIINSNAVVEHDNRIFDFVHVSVGAKLAGTVSVGKSSWVGIGASVSNNVNICGNCMIGAGAVVIRDIEEAGTYVGVPAKRVEMENKQIIDLSIEKIRGGGDNLFIYVKCAESFCEEGCVA